MKYFTAFKIVSFALCATLTTASADMHGDKENKGKKPDKNLIGSPVSPVEKADAIRAVEAYIYSRPPASDTLKLYDSTQESVVTLKLDSIDGDSLRRLDKANLAVSANLMDSDDTPYKVWFIVGPDKQKEIIINYFRKMKVSGLEQYRVKDVILQTAGDQDLFTWESTDSGWTIQR